MTRLTLALTLLFALGACRGSDGAAGPDGATALVDVSTEAAGANCEAGGSKVDYGVDSSGDGTLDAEEVDGTFYVCNGTSGEPAAEVLMESELVFENALGCEQGYESVRIGADDMTVDGALQDAEVETTLTTCLAFDYDGDAALNLDDNCPVHVNPDQYDNDLDRIGNVCDADTKTLYGFTRGAVSRKPISSFLYTVDLQTGESTLVGDIGHSINAMRVNPTDGGLYAITRDGSVGGCDICLIRIDTSTGAGTVTTPLTTENSPYSKKYKKYKKYYPKYSKYYKVQNGPIASMAFLSDGSLFGWTEAYDHLVRINPTSGVVTVMGEYLDSAAHSLVSTADDELLFVNDGDVYLIDPADGVDTFLGSLPDASRGDMNPDTLLYVGVESTRESDPTTLDVSQLSTTDAPQALVSLPLGKLPKGDVFHGFAFDR